MSENQSTASAEEVNVSFRWEVEPYDLPSAVNQVATTTALDGYSDSDTNVILRLGYAMPPMAERVSDGQVEIAIQSLGTFLLSVDTARGIRDTLGEVLSRLENSDEVD